MLLGLGKYGHISMTQDRNERTRSIPVRDRPKRSKLRRPKVGIAMKALNFAFHGLRATPRGLIRGLLEGSVGNPQFDRR